MIHKNNILLLSCCDSNEVVTVILRLTCDSSENIYCDLNENVQYSNWNEE